MRVTEFGFGFGLWVVYMAMNYDWFLCRLITGFGS